MDFYQILAIIIISIIVVVIGIVIFLLKRKNKNKEVLEFPELLQALGGKENINEVSQQGSRVSVLVENKKNIDKEKIKEQDVERLVVSSKKVTMVVGNKKSVLIYNYLNENLNSKN